ncbi:hypothetical protein FKZ61_021820, partial [Litorilinea aerophila]|uniref:hypothetical protein n=1 Tax=Litorilinea aerophila TaxID=1204385 RepID=UPI001B881D42
MNRNEFVTICSDQLQFGHSANSGNSGMAKRRTHFPHTTPQQRKLLFETWEATGNVTLACRKAHVGR